MPLDRYAEKRDFDKTAEPAPAETKSPGDKDGDLLFVIHKHDASRLHYDLRLEVGGVLASWAVPKGPSLDPHDKRLAVHVEDHPLAYGSFSGTIPEGQYGAGTVEIWDTGTYEPESDMVKGLEKGDVKFTLHGHKLGGSWALVRMKPRPGDHAENWLLIKHRDEFADDGSDVTTERPEPVAGGASDADPVPTLSDAPFQLATLTAKAPSGPEWVHEVKYDGYRARISVEGGRARLFTRSNQDWTDKFGPIVSAASHLPATNALLDGEIVVLDKSGVSHFGALQEALSSKNTGAMTYMAFDLLYLDGRDLRQLPLTERKRLLGDLLSRVEGETPLRLSEHLSVSGPEFHDQACRLGLEGSISKRADAPWRPGRGRDWIKTKCLLEQEFVVAGWTKPAGSRAGFGALLLAVNESGGLRYAGRVGTGFSDRELIALRDRLETLAADTPPLLDPPPLKAVHWVRPELVVEVAFLEWTGDGLVRQAKFGGVREDKPAAQIVREMPMDDPLRPTSLQGADASPVVAGVRLSNPDKVLFKPGGADVPEVTKLDLARYYEIVSPLMLPYLEGRPLTLVRCPQGDHDSCFYQRHPEKLKAISPHVHTFDVAETDGESGVYIFTDDLAGVISLVQMGTLEIHTWSSLAADYTRPDRIVFDLDPGPGMDWEEIRDCALLMRDALTALGLASFAKLTGGKGVHVVVPLTPNREYGPVREFARAFAETIAAHDPDRFTSRMAKTLREGRVFIDYLRNGQGATAVAEYSTRAREGAPVSVPISWDELAGQVARPVYFVRDLVRRVSDPAFVDPWSEYDASRVELDPLLLEALGKTMKD